MIEPDTRVDHLMAAAIAKYGVTAVLEQVFVHVTFSARYSPPAIFDEVMATGQKLKEALATVRKWEAMEAGNENKAD